MANGETNTNKPAGKPGAFPGIGAFNKQSIIAGVLIAVVVAGILSLPLFDRVERADTDILHWLRATVAPPTSYAVSEVVVIAIDETTYATPPFSTIPKAMWTPHIASVQNAVLQAGATVVGWDLVLPTSANTYVADTRYDKTLLASLLKKGRKQGKVVLGEVDLGNAPLRPFHAFRRAVGEKQNIRSLNAFVEEDGILRGLPLLLEYQRNGTSEWRPGFAGELAMRHTGRTLEVAENGTTALFGGTPVSTEAGMNLLLNFDPRPGAIPTHSFQDIHRCIEKGDTEYLTQHFAGKAVILGTVLNLEDRKLASNRFITHPDFAGAPPSCTDIGTAPSDFARNATAGVYTHATAFNNLIRGDAVDRPNDVMQILFSFGAAVLAGLLSLAFRPIRSLAAILAMGALYAGISAWMFGTGLELPLLDPLLATGLAFTAGTAYRFVTTDKERRRVQATFSHYLDPKVINAMLDAGDVPELGGESRKLTCFFSDIAAFSTISEKMSPAELVEFLNEYFNIIGKEIEAHHGIIERFLGDAVCAVFGAPVRDEDHAASAISAAIAIDLGLAAAAQRFNVPEGMQVKTRIGINSGAMTVGNVGSRRRYTYTVMGDAVNLAARLESVNKQYGTLLMAGDDTVELCRDRFEWREIDRVRVVGRATPVTLYEPLGKKGDVGADVLRTRDRYEAALALYRAQDFSAAKDAFQKLAAEGDGASGKAVERCDRRMTGLPTPKNWDGVTDLTSK